MTAEGVLEKLRISGHPKALVISGGEPFLQQRQLVPLLEVLRQDGWWVEVETNGTIPPRAEFVSLIDQINCSPKLDNDFSGDPEKLRIRPNALKALVLEPKVNFKFVISQPDDVEQVLRLNEAYGFKEVRLMPECRTREELHEKSPWVKQLCDTHGFIFCTRLSIEMSGTRRGV